MALKDSLTLIEDSNRRSWPYSCQSDGRSFQQQQQQNAMKRIEWKRSFRDSLRISILPTGFIVSCDWAIYNSLLHPVRLAFLPSSTLAGFSGILEDSQRYLIDS